MRRLLLPALMITLLLTGCGGAVPERKMTALRESLSAAQEISLTADVDASIEDEVFSCTLNCTVRPDAVTVEVTAPETIAGIRAVTDAEGTRIEYEGLSLGVGGGNDDQPSPVRALPLLITALRSGSILRSWTEREADRNLIVREYFLTDAAVLAVWFDGETLLPLSAEFREGQAVALRCEIRSFTWS